MGLRRRRQPDPPVAGFPVPPGPAGVPPGQAPFQQAPYQQSQYPQAPYQQSQYPQAPYQQSQYPQAPYQQAPYQQAPYQPGGPAWPGAAAPLPAGPPAPAARSGGVLPFVVMAVVLALAVGIVTVAYQRTRTASFNTPATVGGVPLVQGQQRSAFVQLFDVPDDGRRHIHELYGTEAQIAQGGGYLLRVNDRPNDKDTEFDAAGKEGAGGKIKFGVPQEFPGGIQCRAVQSLNDSMSQCRWRSRHTVGVITTGGSDLAALARVTLQARKDVEG